MTVMVLGTEYEITVKKHTDDEAFSDGITAGYCCESLKKIVVCDLSSYPTWENRSPEEIQVEQRRIMRHEIVHAFLFESGLADDSLAADAWAVNEEMVDWFAAQGPKIYKAWKEAGCV